MKKAFLIALIWLSAFWVLVKINNVYQADVMMEMSQRYLARFDTESALRLINKSIEKNKYEPNYYRLKAKTLIVANGSKEEALGNLNKALSLNPDNLVTVRNVAPLYYFLSAKDINLPSGEGNVDGKYLVPTQEFFKSVKDKYKHDAGVIALIAKYENKLGLEKDYLESVEIMKKLRPDLLEWHESFR